MKSGTGTEEIRGVVEVRIEQAPAALLAQDPVLAEIVRRLVKALHPQRLYLFGSRARNVAREGSDYDVLLIIDTAREGLHALEVVGYSALWGVGASVDVVVMTPAYFESRLQVIASLPSTVQREGKLLYAA